MTDSVWIYSTRDPSNLGPACRLVWGSHEVYASVAAVRQTAEDLFTSAAYAELIGELIRIGLPGGQTAQMVTSMIGARDTPYLGHKETLQVLPAGSTQRQCGVVLISKGSMRGQLDPGEARAMGRTWLAAAEASEADTLFDRVLRRAGGLGDTELNALFDLLLDMRTGNPDIEDPI
ncbi:MULTISPECIES: hypothetical protein [Actinomadura]|uniref:MarR family transcriptional regulator n=1 Tax=Actinomadura yumaensis TaxID=111807 RepID=A0ABW2CU87_9ACTN|nr:hypothetical protein [Actinomadura sp. J1-007]MWK39595.1 hypothetical protein [Actinomadura sp. J1-007]